MIVLCFLERVGGLSLDDPTYLREIIQRSGGDRIDDVEEGLFRDREVIAKLSEQGVLVFSHAIQSPLMNRVGFGIESEFKHFAIHGFVLFFLFESPVYVNVLTDHRLERD
jgi:hypothetical protein